MKTGSLYGSSIPFHTSNNSRCSLSKSGYKSGGANNNSGQLSDRDSVSGRSKRSRIRKGSNGSIKITRNMSKKKNLDFTDFAYREAVGRLKFLLAESYTSTKPALQYRRHLPDDSGEETDNQSQGTDRPALSEISKYMPPKYKTNRSLFKKTATTPKPFSPQNQSHYSSAKDYDTSSQNYQLLDPAPRPPPEILSFIEKQEDYIEQLEKESKFCRDELSNLLGKVRDVISENEALTEHARSDLVSHGAKMSASSESEDNHYDRFIRNRKERTSIRSSHPLSGPNIIFESRISELEAELAQANIDLKKIRSENEELKRKSASSVTLATSSESSRKQVDSLERDKIHLEETIRKLHQTIEDLRSEGNQVATKTQRNRDLADMAMFEKSQAEIEIRRLKEELERQHERIRELQHEMSRRVTEERANAERRYNYQVDQLGGDLSSQWEQASKLQLDVERQKRIESDLKRDLSQRNAQIEELKLELKDKKTNFLTDLAQLNAEKQSLEQEITSLRLQLERAERQSKIEAARLNAEISSLRQRLDRSDADILHARRENLRLNDDIANLEKDVALGEMKGEIRPTTKDLNKTIMEMEQKHVGTVVELEEMIQSQRQLMDKLTKECKTLTNKLEETTLKHNEEKKDLRVTNEMLMERLRQLWTSYKNFNRSARISSDTESSYHDETFGSSELQSNMNHQQLLTPQPLTTECHHRTQADESIHQSPNPVHTTSTPLHPTAVPNLDQYNHHQLLKTTETPTTIETMKMKRTEIRRKNTPSSYLQKIQNRMKAKRTAPNNNNTSTPISPISSNTLNNNTNSQTILKPTTNNNIPDKSMAVPTINPTTYLNIKEASNSTTNTIHQNSIKPTNQKLTNSPTINNLFPIPTYQQPSQPHYQDKYQNQQAGPSHYQQPNLQDYNNPQQQYQQQWHQQQSLHQHQQPPKATLNRERAATLWGYHRLETETKDQTFCRNSLPRRGNECQQQWPETNLEDLELMNAIDPYDLIPEFDISSPSLFERSTDSGDSSDATLEQTIIYQLP